MSETPRNRQLKDYYNNTDGSSQSDQPAADTSKIDKETSRLADDILAKYYTAAPEVTPIEEQKNVPIKSSGQTMARFYAEVLKEREARGGNAQEDVKPAHQEENPLLERSKLIVPAIPTIEADLHDERDAIARGVTKISVIRRALVKANVFGENTALKVGNLLDSEVTNMVELAYGQLQPKPEETTTDESNSAVQKADAKERKPPTIVDKSAKRRTSPPTIKDVSKPAERTSPPIIKDVSQDGDTATLPVSVNVENVTQPTLPGLENVVSADVASQSKIDVLRGIITHPASYLATRFATRNIFRRNRNTTETESEKKSRKRSRVLIIGSVAATLVAVDRIKSGVDNPSHPQ